MRFVCLLCVVFVWGCKKPPVTTAEGLRLLTMDELTRYVAAEEAFQLKGRSLVEIRTDCALDPENMTYDLKRFRFTIPVFLQVAELVFLARHGREIFAELPYKRERLARRLMALLDEPEDAALRKRIKEAYSELKPEQSELESLILANAQILDEFERRR